MEWSPIRQVIDGGRATALYGTGPAARLDGMSAASSQHANPMRLAVGHVEDAVGKQHSMGSVELAREGIVLRAIALLSRAQDRGDDSGFQIHAADGVVFRVRDVQ